MAPFEPHCDNPCFAAWTSWKRQAFSQPESQKPQTNSGKESTDIMRTQKQANDNKINAEDEKEGQLERNKTKKSEREQAEEKTIN